MLFMDFTTIEHNWRQTWEREHVFEPEPAKGKKKFVTAAFPYPNSPQHIGHGRTYTTLDIYARYLRMLDYNVLFPMGFHVTGTPIIAMAKRIADRDPEVLEIFEKIYGIDRATSQKLTAPEQLVMYFSKEIEQGMHEMGYSIDWRRKFYSFDKKFNRFIQWQFHKLKQLGYIVQGEHPIAWCPSDKQAVGGHDTRGDVDPELKEFTAIKFRYKDGYLLTATLRPETIYGVTNIWINPDLLYVKAKSGKNGEIYYISKKAYEKMNWQGFELKILEEFIGSKLLNKTSKNLVMENSLHTEYYDEAFVEIPLYPAPYVKDDTGTGVVMSVPSHAPYDHIALLDMGIKLDYTQIIKVEGYGFMAQELIEQRGIKNQHDQKLEDIVKEVYKKEILTGVMVAGPFKGERVSVAIEKTKKDLFDKNFAIRFLEIDNKPVYCRCGSEVVATVLKNQWFIDYGNEKWKNTAKQCLEHMKIIPEKSRGEYLYAIDWFKQKACARASGLGTRFPFDEKLMIEALSDSTIYMAFYTFAHLLGEIEEKEMNEEFFDYVLLGKEPKNKKLKANCQRLRASFLYWYPCDSRHSAGDLIRNHLPFYIFNHVAIFPKEHWPKQIVTNGFVLMDGKKMSKSMGNILPLRKAIREYGADVIRFSIVSGADLTQDTDFNKSVAEGTKTRLEFIARLVEETASGKWQVAVSHEPKANSQKPIDNWLQSRLNKKIKLAKEYYEKFAIRELALEIFYDLVNDLHWYIKRTNQPQLKDFLKTWSLLIAPFMPYVAEEFWHKLGGKGLVVSAKFPKADDKKIDETAEMGENLVKETLADIENVIKLIGKQPQNIYIYVAGAWKHKLYEMIKKEKAFDKVMKLAAQDPELKTIMNDVQRVTKQLIKNAHSLPETLSEKGELVALQDAITFFERELKCKIFLLHDKDGKHEKSKNALPNKPAIMLE